MQPEQILQIAQWACFKARELIPKSSNQANNIDEEFLADNIKLGAMRTNAQKQLSPAQKIIPQQIYVQSLDEEIEKFIQTTSKYFDSLSFFSNLNQKNISSIERIKKIAREAIKWGRGNCGELSCVVFLLLDQYPKEGLIYQGIKYPAVTQKIPIQLMNAIDENKNTFHTLVVMDGIAVEAWEGSPYYINDAKLGIFNSAMANEIFASNSKASLDFCEKNNDGSDALAGNFVGRHAHINKPKDTNLSTQSLLTWRNSLFRDLQKDDLNLARKNQKEIYQQKILINQQKNHVNAVNNFFKNFKPTSIKNKNKITAMVFFNNDQLLISSTLGGNIKITDLETMQCKNQLQLSTSISSLALSPNGQYLAAGLNNGYINLIEINSLKLINSIKIADTEISSLAYSHNQQQLICGTDFKIVILSTVNWNIETTLDAHSITVHSLAIDPKNHYLASGGTNSIILWNLQSYKILLKIPGSTYHLQFSPTGKYFAYGTYENKTIVVKDSETWQTIHELKGHTGWIMDICFSANESELVSVSADKKIRIWDLQSGQCLYILNEKSEAHPKWITSVAPSKNHTFFASGDDLGNISIWHDIASDNINLSVKSPSTEEIATPPQELRK